MRVRISRDRVKAAMKMRRTTYGEMAVKAGVNIHTVSDWCDTEFPLVEEVAQIVEAHPLTLLEEKDGGLVLDRERVKAELERKGLGVVDLADRLGIARPNIYQQVFNRPLKNLNKLAALLEVNPFSLLEFGE